MLRALVTAFALCLVAGVAGAQPAPWTAPTQEACAASPECLQLGLCVAGPAGTPRTPGPTGCIAVQESCAASLRCRQLGFCTEENGQCVIGGDRDCRMSYACHTHGLCASAGQRCAATTPQHCADATICEQLGACTTRGGICVRDDADPGSHAPTVMRSEAMRNVGIAFTIAGPVLAAIATPMFFAEEATAVAAAFMAPTAGVLIVLGVPFWAIGAGEIPAGTEPQGMGALATGIVLAGLGFSAVTVSAFFLAATDDNGAGIPMAIGAAGIIGGVAAAAWGIQAQPVGEEATLTIGPGTAELTWRF